MEECKRYLWVRQGPVMEELWRYRNGTLMNGKACVRSLKVCVVVE